MNSFNGLTVQYFKIADLLAYRRKVRVHSTKQREKLKAGLTRFGQLAPVLIDDTNTIIDGHLVVEVMTEMGHDQVAVIVVANRHPAEIKAIRLALNRLPQDAGWNSTELKLEFEELLTLGFDMAVTGFDTVEIDMALAIDDPSAGEVEDAPQGPQAGPAVSKPGDIWHLGDHRLACGDARDGQLIKALMAGASAQMVFSDPPYNVRISGNAVGAGRHREFAFASGEMSKAEFTGFLADALAHVAEVMVDGGVAFVCMDWRHIEELLAAANAAGLTQLNLAVWTKTNPGMGSLYRSQHELVFVLKKGDGPHINNVELGKHGRARSNVWPYRGMTSFGAERDALLGAHPTVKPVALVADAIKDVSRRGDLVFDPFLGSGTTLIAAHRTGRRCFGVELDPNYADVIIRRWETETGRQAVLAATGETFDACSSASLSLPAPMPQVTSATPAEG